MWVNGRAFFIRWCHKKKHARPSIARVARLVGSVVQYHEAEALVGRWERPVGRESGSGSGARRGGAGAGGRGTPAERHSAVVGGGAGAVRRRPHASPAAPAPSRAAPHAGRSSVAGGGWSHRVSPSHICNFATTIKLCLFNILHSENDRRGCEHL